MHKGNQAGKSTTWRGLEPWIQARVKSAVLGYRAQMEYVYELERAAIEPGRVLDDVGGGRGNATSDPTFAAAMRVDRLRARQILAYADIAAVDEALHEILKDIDGEALRRRMTDSLIDSFAGRKHNAAAINGLYISERSYWRIWRRFALLVAENLHLM